MSVDLTGDLFPATLPTHARARRGDPRTSVEAAKAVERFSSQHCTTILASLKRHGPMTISEIGARTGLDHVAVARRMSELERMALAGVVCDERGEALTRMGPSGREQRIWRAL